MIWNSRNFPGTNLNDINLDWLIKQMKALNDAFRQWPHSPRIENGEWYVYDEETGEYVSTGVPATGEQGPTGPQGPQGPQGVPGPSGMSAFFVAEYNVTAYEDIQAAIADGKYVCASRSSAGYYPLTGFAAGSDLPNGNYLAYFFARFDVDSSNNKKLYKLTCKKYTSTGTTVWTSETLPVELADDVLEPIEADIADLKSAVDILGISPEQLTVTDNRYYNLSAESITIDSPTQLNDYECAVIPCTEGDIFYVSCAGQSKSRAWGYVDVEGAVLSRASANLTAVNVYTSSPANSAYLILNNLKAANVTMSARKVSAKYLTTEYTADKRLFNGADLDTLTSAGTYFMQSASDAINTPIATIGKIIVLAMRPRSPLNYLLQIFITVSGRIFTRSNFNRSIWSDWTELASKQNLADAMSETVNNSKDITIPDSANIEQNKLLDFSYGYIRLVNSALWDTTDYIGVENVDLTYFAFQKIRIAEYTENQQALKVVDVQDMAAINFLPQTKYIRISFYKPDNAKADIALLCLDANTKKAISAVYNALDQSSLSYARHNAIAAANQMAKIEWTPIRPIPVTNSAGYISAGTKCVGLPYSSTRTVCKYIGQHLSFYTFMSALQNPRSVLYTRIITSNPLGKTYYGVTCFTFTSYSAGSRLGLFDNEITRMFDGSNIEISPYEIQPGDALQLTYDRESLPDPSSAEPQPYQHCILIYDVSKDAFGRIRTVQLAEATNPFTQIKNTITFDSFMSNYITGGFKYKVFRKNGRLDYGAYKAINEVKGYEDEEPAEVVYPDIMPEYGDKACIEADTTVAINVIDAKSYTQIQIIKNGTVIETKNSIADFNMPSMSAGTYKFRITDGTNSTESSLIVADVNGSYDANTKKVTFSSSNATPVFAASYITTSDLKGVQNRVKYFTAEEQTQGWADVSDIVGQYYDAVQIGFLTEYGVAMWRSTPLANEWEYWTPPTS